MVEEMKSEDKLWIRTKPFAQINEKHLKVHNPRHFIQPMATSYTTSVFCTCVFNTSYYYSKVKSTRQYITLTTLFSY